MNSNPSQLSLRRRAPLLNNDNTARKQVTQRQTDTDSHRPHLAYFLPARFACPHTLPAPPVSRVKTLPGESFSRRCGSMSSSSGAPESWIASFCSLLGHEYFAEVTEEFIEDDFNLTGLQTQVAMYKDALEVSLSFFSFFFFCSEYRILAGTISIIHQSYQQLRGGCHGALWVRLVRW